jgi:D-alanyl-D-alanine dipeptidase
MGQAVKPTESAAKKANKGLKALSAAAAARAVDLKKADEVQQQAVQVGAAMDHLDDRSDAHANGIHNIHQLPGTSPADAAARARMPVRLSARPRRRLPR